MKLEYKNYPLTYNGCLLEYNNILNNENSGIYLRVPGLFKDVEWKFENEKVIQINGVSTPCFGWIRKKDEFDSLGTDTIFTIEKNPLLGAPAYAEEFKPRFGLSTYIAGYVSKPDIIVIPLIVVQPNSASETIKLERINSEEIIDGQSYSVWDNNTLGQSSSFCCLNENPIEVGTKVYTTTINITFNGTTTLITEYGTIVEYKPGLIT